MMDKHKAVIKLAASSVYGSIKNKDFLHSKYDDMSEYDKQKMLKMMDGWKKEGEERAMLLNHPDAQRLIMEKRQLDAQAAPLDGRVAKVSEAFYNMNLVKKFAGFELVVDL